MCLVENENRLVLRVALKAEYLSFSHLHKAKRDENVGLMNAAGFTRREDTFTPSRPMCVYWLYYSGQLCLKTAFDVILYTVFQKKFTPRTFMITVWNENQFK